ncbi:MAG: hydroxyacid dehydrogenase [Clostridiales bacterium]|nr:hydroxyacid dehydrogenase [Clostridiales bacterium]
MNILLNVAEDIIKKKYFPKQIMDRLESLGNVKQNMLDHPWSEDELAEEIKGMDICITHWRSHQITPKVVKNADKLKFIGHCAGSVFNIVCQDVFEKGIKVSSANKIMAKAVAESTLAYILTSRLKLKKFMALTKNGGWKAGVSEYGDMKSLHGSDVLLVGFGDIAKFLYDLLVPFNVNLTVYDPFLKQDVIDSYPDVYFVNDLDAAIEKADIISIHASRNPGSQRLIGKDRIDSIKNDALFVNTARGSIVDEKYLTEVLKSGRIYAALDVFEEEPLAAESALRNLPNVICMPHVSGSSVVLGYAEAMIGEIENIINSKPLVYEISAEKAGMMTRS